jgi:hypothetical protein
LRSSLRRPTYKTKHNKTQQNTHTTYKQQQQQKHQFLGRVVDGCRNKHTNDKQTGHDRQQQQQHVSFFYDGGSGGGGGGGFGGNGGGVRGVGGGDGVLSRFVRGLHCFLCFLSLAVGCVTGV